MLDQYLLDEISEKCKYKLKYGYDIQEKISTGIKNFDKVLNGGIPKGKIIEIHGDEDTGKSALALFLANKCGRHILLIDGEYKFSHFMLINKNKLFLLKLNSFEDVLNACKLLTDFDAIIIDSIPSIPTNLDNEIKIDNNGFEYEDTHAKILSKALPIINHKLNKSKCTLFLINQMRDKPYVYIGRKETPTGGNAIKNYASLILETKRTNLIHKQNKIIGQEMQVNIVKNKYGFFNRSYTLNLMYDKGIVSSIK